MESRKPTLREKIDSFKGLGMHLIPCSNAKPKLYSQWQAPVVLLKDEQGELVAYKEAE